MGKGGKVARMSQIHYSTAGMGVLVWFGEHIG